MKVCMTSGKGMKFLDGLTVNHSLLVKNCSNALRKRREIYYPTLFYGDIGIHTYVSRCVASNNQRLFTYLKKVTKPWTYF